MGRRAGAPTVRKHGRYWYARFTVDGERREINTGVPIERDRQLAVDAAEKARAEAVLAAGPARIERPRLGDGLDLADLGERYLAWLGAQGKDRRYVNEQRIHFRAHFLCIDEEGTPTRWTRLRELNSRGISEYQKERAALVSSVTLYKELVSLSRFLKWCRDVEGVLEQIPHFTRPVQHSDYQPPNLAPDQVQALLKACPTRAQDPQGHPVREWATFTHEMALRLTESRSIEWRDVDLDAVVRLPGGGTSIGTLLVREEIDKAGQDWVLPLTTKARAILVAEAKRPHAPYDRVFPMTRMGWDKLGAAAAALKLPHVTAHHLRHFRLTELGHDTRDVASLQFFARHTHLSTTSKYVRSRTEAAAAMISTRPRRR